MLSVGVALPFANVRGKILTDPILAFSFRNACNGIAVLVLLLPRVLCMLDTLVPISARLIVLAGIIPITRNQPLVACNVRPALGIFARIPCNHFHALSAFTDRNMDLWDF